MELQNINNIELDNKQTFHQKEDFDHAQPLQAPKLPEKENVDKLRERV